jgi:primosomal protein N' (replication factor Y)
MGPVTITLVARVALDSSNFRVFDYGVPDSLEDRVRIGVRVQVPLRNQICEGIVIALQAKSGESELRNLKGVCAAGLSLSPSGVALAEWIASYYRCPLGLVIKSFLPGAVRRKGASHAVQCTVRLNPQGAVGEKPLTKAQQRLVAVLEEYQEMPRAELLRAASTSAATLRRLELDGIVLLRQGRRERDPYANDLVVATQALVLNEEQSVAVNAICASILVLDPLGTTKEAPPAAYLLHGVTGSGKTEIYLQAIEVALRQGGGAIVLVPEISLTPQTVERFRARFAVNGNAEIVAVLHSHLSEGERHDEWHKIQDGRAKIVIGARSAIFAPVANLNLIIVDEEHEHSYKQEESPKYHARDVAVMRGKLENAVVVLGSATPSMESYRNATAGRYRLLQLQQRAMDICMPVVRIVDMRMETRGGKPTGSIISQPLRDAIALRIERKEQTILFLNRRGYSTSLICEKCGQVEECPHCSVALTYHRSASQLLCHICGHEASVPAACRNPACGNPAIRYSGLGTERVEEVLGKMFPKAVVRRMDSDTLKRKNDFKEILSDFRTGKLDILLGTQMIAKGLDFPNVTLVGIVNADLGLHIPDFRAGERTFQLLTQVSGRAGRGDVEGEVFVQTFTPFHPAIQFARRHDFLGFYEQEIGFRQQLSYPPFSRIALVTIKGRSEEKVRFCAEQLFKELQRRTAALAPILNGPAPAPLVRAESYFRYQIMLRTPKMSKLSAELADLNESFPLPEDVTYSIDVDPVSLQ